MVVAGPLRVAIRKRLSRPDTFSTSGSCFICSSQPGGVVSKLTSSTFVPEIDAFTFIGRAAFTGAKGELRVGLQGAGAIVMGDVNGDGAADFEIELLNFTALTKLTAIDFIR